MSTWIQVLISTEAFVHGEKSVHCLYKTDFVKVSGEFCGFGFLGSGQNRRRLLVSYMAMSILLGYSFLFFFQLSFNMFV